MLNTLAINGVELIASDDFIVLADGITGLESPDRRLPSGVKPGADGGYFSAGFLGMRGVTISGVVTGRGVLGKDAAREALIDACDLVTDELGAPVEAVVNLTRTQGDSYTFNAVVTNFTSPRQGIGSMDFSIGLLADDPLLYGTTWKTTGLINVPSGGGVLVPFLEPMFVGPSSGGIGFATNAGKRDTPPLILLTGPLTNPFIQNATTGLYAQLAYTIALGDVVTIDTSDNTIVLNGSTGLLNKEADNFSWWKLSPGQNRIGFSSGSSSDTGTLEVRWRDARGGI